jgi:hypothetical protein
MFNVKSPTDLYRSTFHHLTLLYTSNFYERETVTYTLSSSCSFKVGSEPQDDLV